MMIDEIKNKKNKNDRSQPDSTFKTCDNDHKTGSQHKRQIQT
jgi:hypothetical protein